MSSSSSANNGAPSDAPPTLYHPAPANDMDLVPDDASSYVTLPIALPPDAFERLRTVAQQLGLTPSTVAARAIQMICDEVVTIEDRTLETGALIEEYQTRLDLLHASGTDGLDRNRHAADEA